MKHFIGSAAALFLTLAFLLAGSGCSKEEQSWGNKDINVTKAIGELKSPDKETRVQAAIALAGAGENAAPAVSALTEALKDNAPDVRRLAAYALGEIGPKAAPAIPALKELMADRDGTVVQQVVNSLRNIDPKAAGDIQFKNVTTQ
jgi:HEAT repeat protein